MGKLVPPDKYPLAVKPVKGMKNQGVHLHIQTAETVCEAIREIRGQGTGKGRVLLEQMVAGETNRIMVYGGEVVSVVRTDVINAREPS